MPTFLPRLPVPGTGHPRLPMHLNWSQPNRRFKLSDRGQRARVYEIVLREGTPADALSYIDDAPLVDLWDNLVLPEMFVPHGPTSSTPLWRTWRSDLRGGDADGLALTGFQVRVAQLFFCLPAAQGILLAGGAALVAQHLTTLPTRTSTSSRGWGPPNVRTHGSHSWFAIYDTL